MLGRGSYPSSYSLSRNPFPSQVSGINDISRYSHYSNIPPILGNQVEPSNTVYSPHGNLLLEPLQRTGQPAADAPPFHDTVLLHAIMANGQTIRPEIQAKIHKGFFQVEDKWTCYRRNYFSVSCSFSLRPWTPNTGLYLQLLNRTTERIHSFSMSISAVVNGQDGEIRELVQHTPKRDKQSEKKPEKVALQPQQPFPLGSNVGPGAVSSHPAFGVHSHAGGMLGDYPQPYANTLQSSHPPTQHTFERIQFQKATANNGKRRAQQQYYNLVVELHAEIRPVAHGVGSQWVRIAKKLSHSMVVRGRSPGHYKDGRRDSSASMGPDSGGTGSSGDGGRGPMLPPGLGQAPFPHLPLMSYDASQRGGPHQYSRTGPEQRPFASTDQSPSSTGALVSSSSSSSSPFEFTIFSDSMDGVESMEESVSSYHDVALDLGSSNRKLSISSTSHQSHLSSLDFSPHSEEHDGTDSAFDDTFESVVPGYGEQEDAYLKPSPSLGSVSLHAETGTNRTSESSYGRFDPIQSARSLCT
jgi:meiosis-specific transcription factor NDT80